MRRFYCYDQERGLDPHAREILLSDEDTQRYFDVANRERVGRSAVGKYVEVIDHVTQERVKVATHPCGLGCHCGMVCLPVEAETPVAS